MLYPRLYFSASPINETHYLFAGGYYYTHGYYEECQIFTEVGGFVPTTSMLNRDGYFCLVKVSGNRVLRLGGSV